MQLPDTISVAAPLTVSNEGEYAYDTPASVLCKLEHKREQVKNIEGQMVLSEHAIVTETAIGPQDRIWLPGQSTSDATLARTPQTIEQASGIGSGNTIYEIRL
jgi:hypothetical protein